MDNRSYLKKIDHERERNEWMENHIQSSIPDWESDVRKRFEYNGLYDFWRKTYHQKSRELLRDYEKLVAKLQIPDGYELVINYSGIDISRSSPRYKNEYSRLIENIPMNSPIEPEAIWRSNWQNEEVGLVDCSFQNIKKTHVFHSFHKAPMLRQEIFMNKWLGPQGYTMRMFFKGSGGETEYLLGITHSSESPDPFIQAITADGYKPMTDKQRASGKPKVKVKQKPKAGSPAEIDQLSAREQELMAELAAIRTKMSEA